MDINNYTNELLLDFLDAFHREMSTHLKVQFGDEWLEQGVRKHFRPDYFVRIEAMLKSPMRAVDMPREADELFGVEHLFTIIDGNWGLFKEKLREREKVGVYLTEITELRHNLAHRRKNHLVRVDDLIRFTQNARRLLEAIGAVESNRFASIVDSLAQGGKPWGKTLGGHLPHLDEVYDEFIGRPDQLRSLGNWFMSDSKPIVVWGYGGAGKSALALKFAKEVQESAFSGIDAVLWLTAKRSEFVEGIAQERSPDFVDTQSFCRGIWKGLYGEVPTTVSDAEDELIDELNETTCLIVVDDLDTLLDDTDTADFLLYSLRACKSKILYTSRQRVPGLKHIEVPGFQGEELHKFIEQRALDYGVSVNDCLRRSQAIHSVTDGYPLFVDDLIRYSILVGIDDALQDWSQRQGDAAREYALSRQLQHLQKESVGGDVLMAIAVSSQPLTLAEIGQVVGVTDQDADLGVQNLLKWHLLYKSVREEDSSPAFHINANTRRLTLNTFKSNPRLSGMRSALATITGERIPQAKRRAIAAAISEASRVLRTDGIDAATAGLKSRMTGELADAADLYGTLGWIYAQSEEHLQSAREAFGYAYKLGSKKVETYINWIEMEKKIAERMVGQIHERDLLLLWSNALKIADIALERCGDVDALCQLAGYLRGRQARTHEYLNEFALAQGAYRTSVEWFQKSLNAPSQANERVSRYHAYRGLAISYAGLNDSDGLVRALNNWKTLARNDFAFLEEVRRIVWKLPEVERRLPWL